MFERMEIKVFEDRGVIKYRVNYIGKNVVYGFVKPL